MPQCFQQPNGPLGDQATDTDRHAQRGVFRLQVDDGPWDAQGSIVGILSYGVHLPHRSWQKGLPHVPPGQCVLLVHGSATRTG